MDILAVLHGWGDVALLALRASLGAVFLSHGMTKWGTWKMQSSEQMGGGMLNMMRFLSIVEPLGGIAVILGLFTQFAAMGFALVMLGAIWMKIRAWKMPFTTTTATGWEFDLMNLTASLLLVTAGAGMYSLDRWILGL